MNFDEGVQFDPGFVAHISAFVPNVEYLYNTINRFKNFSQKKSQFKMYFPKLEKLLDDYQNIVHKRGQLVRQLYETKKALTDIYQDIYSPVEGEISTLLGDLEDNISFQAILFRHLTCFE